MVASTAAFTALSKTAGVMIASDSESDTSDIFVQAGITGMVE